MHMSMPCRCGRDRALLPAYNKSETCNYDTYECIHIHRHSHIRIMYTCTHTYTHAWSEETFETRVYTKALLPIDPRQQRLVYIYKTAIYMQHPYICNTPIYATPLYMQREKDTCISKRQLFQWKTDICWRRERCWYDGVGPVSVCC